MGLQLTPQLWEVTMVQQTQDKVTTMSLPAVRLSEMGMEQECLFLTLETYQPWTVKEEPVKTPRDTLEIEHSARHTIPVNTKVTLELVEQIRELAGAPKSAELQIYGSTVTFTWIA